MVRTGRSVVYSDGDRSFHRRSALVGSPLSFTFWVVGLVALAAIVFVVQRAREKRSDRREREQKASRSRQSRAEADRLAILDLAKNLTASAPSEDGGTEKEPSASKVERTRRSTESAHGFDPDLPPRRG